jgi:hypothetical protein
MFLEQDEFKILHEAHNLDILLAILTSQTLLSYSRLRKVVIEILIRISESNSDIPRLHL